MLRRAWLVVAASLVVGCHDGSRPIAPKPAPTAATVSVAGTGPIADFAPMEAILTHESVTEMAPELPGKLTAVLGSRHVTTSHHWASADSEPDEDPTDESVVWMRDYQPIFVREPNGELVALRYLSQNPNRAGWSLPWPKVRQRPLPVLHENGNLVSTGRWVFATDALIQENGTDLDDLPDLSKLGFRPRSHDALLRLLSKSLRKPKNDIIILPQMPHEATGHIDIFLLPLADNTVMIPKIEESALALVSDLAFEVGQDVRLFLDDQAADLSALGLEVLRLPMIPPALGYDDEEAEGSQDFDLVVFTPANMLLSQTPEGKFAFIPKFANIAEDPKMLTLLEHYEKEWQELLNSRGWQPHFVDTSELVSHLGLLRCVTASIPE